MAFARKIKVVINVNCLLLFHFPSGLVPPKVNRASNTNVK